jgi:hypothetical protein
VQYKHAQSHRHNFNKPKYTVTNWPEYYDALRRRDDITIWFTEAEISEWRPEKTGARGRSQEYSDHAIATAILIRQVFHLPLRQTEGFMNSLTCIMNAAISIPDFSSISRRSIELPRHVLSKAQQPGSLVIVDSTGLKVYGKDEWHQEKNKIASRRTWRKLHLAGDENHQILACELTTPEVGDHTTSRSMLDQIVTPFETFMGDGAFDGEPVSNAVLAKQPNAKIVVPLNKTAVCSAAGDTQRDRHIRDIKEHGRIAWQKKTDYGLRTHVELAIQRYKRIFGNLMKARGLPQQKSEAWISASALNTMTNPGMPVSVKI